MEMDRYALLEVALTLYVFAATWGSEAISDGSGSRGTGGLLPRGALRTDAAVPVRAGAA